MSQIVKAFLGVFLTLFMAVVALGVLSTYMEVMNAQDMQARVVDLPEPAGPVTRTKPFF